MPWGSSGNNVKITTLIAKKTVRKEDELRGRGSGNLVQMSCKDTDMNTAPINMSSYRLQA